MPNPPWSGEERRAGDRRAPAVAEPYVFAPSGAAAPPSAAPASTAPAVDPQAFEKGVAEGQARSRAGFEQNLAEVRAQMTAALGQFAQQREGYFRQVEREVVQLSLSIARKILHREVQMDPLLLAGIVRVALENLNSATQVRLRAHPAEVPLWRTYFQNAPVNGVTPELLGDPSLAAGCCILETELGSTQISLDTQLKEIEQGFLDLLEQRPRESA
jgi:flagellar assembly protein FliH